MPHDIEILDNGEAAFFSGENKTAWHGLGQVVEGTKTAAEALELAHLNWTVSLRPTFFQDASGAYLASPDHYAVVRDSDDRALGHVGGDYKPFQNVEAFSFFDTVTDSTGEAHYTTAGSLKGGSRVFMTAKIGETFTVAGEDAHEMYLIISNSHDGTKAFTAMTSMVRVVCQNTMTMALKNAKTKWSLRHTTSLTGKAQQARESLALATKYETAFEKEVERLLAVDVNVDQFVKIVSNILPDQKRQKQRNVEELTGIWLGESTVAEAAGAGTGWGALNAATYWTDHTKASRSEEARFMSITDGFAQTFRNDVRDAVLALA